MAASDFHFYSRIFTELSDVLSSYVQATASSVCGAISPVATTLLTIYVMLWGWSMMRGGVTEPISKVLNILPGFNVFGAGRYGQGSETIWPARSLIRGLY
ncbi:MAG: hypothetical protein LBD67_05880 [Candidatus Accumulibacter sp.]|jgi:type IV secretory pathway VirB6-like protein|nr:hypothetical protein [Accumulibacter sp.]